MKKHILITLIPIFLIFVLGFIIYGGNESKAIMIKKEIPNNTIDFKKYIKDISYNKIIIIGDSRMQRLRDRRNTIDIPVSFNFIAEGGAKINWVKNEALTQLFNILDNMEKEYKYHVIINMGVNDLEDNLGYIIHADEYYNLITNLIEKYPNVNFYFLSVNPIIEKTLNKWQPWSYRTNEKIELFNSYLNNRIENVDYNNYYYCDSYNQIDFIIPDGIHYDKETDQKITDFIAKKCINYYVIDK